MAWFHGVLVLTLVLGPLSREMGFDTHVFGRCNHAILYVCLLATHPQCSEQGWWGGLVAASVGLLDRDS